MAPMVAMVALLVARMDVIELVALLTDELQGLRALTVTLSLRAALLVARERVLHQLLHLVALRHGALPVALSIVRALPVAIDNGLDLAAPFHSLQPRLRTILDATLVCTASDLASRALLHRRLVAKRKLFHKATGIQDLVFRNFILFMEMLLATNRRAFTLMTRLAFLLPAILLRVVLLISVVVLLTLLVVVPLILSVVVAVPMVVMLVTLAVVVPPTHSVVVALPMVVVLLTVAVVVPLTVAVVVPLTLSVMLVVVTVPMVAKCLVI